MKRKILLNILILKVLQKLEETIKPIFAKSIDANWEQNGNELKFTISADRFLRNMVQ
jgi:tRNA pseudouridine38-40 synthase